MKGKFQYSAAYTPQAVSMPDLGAKLRAYVNDGPHRRPAAPRNTSPDMAEMVDSIQSAKATIHTQVDSRPYLQRITALGMSTTIAPRREGQP